MTKIDKHILPVSYQELKDFLAYEFRSQIRSRGKAIFQRGHVLNYTVLRDEIQAQVQGGSVYLVQFYLDSGVIIGTDCSCPYGGACKHGAALAYFLMELLKAGAKQLAIQEKVDKPKLQRSDDFHVLSGLPIQALLRVLKPQIPYWVERNPIEHQLLLPGEIKSRLYTENWQQDRQLVADLDIKKERGSILIKCNNCDKKSDKLCWHEYISLKNLSESTPGLDWLEDRFDFDSQIADIASRRKMSTDNLLKTCNVFIVNDIFGIRPATEGLMLNMSQDKLIDMIETELGLHKTLEEDFLQEMEKNLQFRNAIVWMPADIQFKSTPVRIIEGKTDAQQTKLASYIREVDYPFHFNQPERLFFKELTEGLMLKSSESEVGDKTIYEAILNHWDAFTGIMHYYKMYDYMRHYHYEIKKKDIRQIRFSNEKIQLNIKAFLENELFILQASLICGGRSLEFKDIAYCNSIFVCDQRDQAYLLESVAISKAIDFFRDKPKFIFFPDDKAKLLSMLDILCRKFALEIDLPFVKVIPVEKISKMIYLKEIGDYVAFEPFLGNDDIKLRLTETQKAEISRGTMKIHQLDSQFSSSFVSEVQSLHPHWLTSTSYHLTSQQLIENFWFVDFFERCKELSIDVYGQENLKKFKYNPYKAKISTEVTSGIDWFDLNVQIKFGDQTLSTKDWIEAVKNNTQYVKLGDGSIGILPEVWLNRLKEVQKIASFDKNKMKISKLRFNVVEQLFDDQEIDARAREEIANKKKKLAAYSSKEDYVLPPTIQATLREYQLAGFKWLKFLQEFGFGGCLADDMGLGKTLQAICLLADQKLKKGGCSLVVAPKTLLFNWASELDKFCPSLQYLIYHGPGRTKITRDLKKQDVVISTYDTVSMDINTLGAIKWNYVILDESQAIKNPGSIRYKAMCLLKARFKLVMTGTPIENSTFDLFAQMNFANPSLLGTMTSFKQNFVLPIEKNQDQTASTLLHNIIYPFILRRTKDQVATDLPEKTESILYCEMEEAQRDQYLSLKEQIKLSVKSKVEKEGVGKSKFIILEALLRLRQMCNSPRLLDSSLKGKESDSIKIDTLIEHITTETGQRNALIFSQFVTMLTLIREKLDALNIPYAYLDGSTNDRQAAVRKFNEEEDHRIFLMSLKAGNTGLNLVKADYVYIVDPWWNPAVEAQAIDRTHRIGQDKHIFAYKLICKDTIEEKIIQLQQKKKKLAQDIIHTDASVFKSLSKDDLLALFD